MLVLARKIDESIVIGDDIVVKVISVDNGVVKLGIDAPKDVSILRDELAREVALSNKAALHASDEDELKSLGKLLGK